MNNNTDDKKVKFEIITIHDDEEKGKHKGFAKFKSLTSKKMNDLKDWYKYNKESGKMDENKEKIKKNVDKFVNKTKEKITELKEDEELREKFHNGKEKVVEVSSNVFSTISETVEDVMTKENVQNAMNAVGTKFNEVKNDERVKSGVKKMKKGTLKVAESAMSGLRKVLETEDDD